MTRTPRSRSALSRAALAGLCSAFLVLQPLVALPSYAGPKGIKVVRGKVKVKHRGKKTVIKASDRAIIRYRNFDIARGERVRFVQPGRNARVLNRVKGPGATRIDGALSANGRVTIVNRQGVHIGRGAVVKVAALAAVAGDISNRDFVNGVEHYVGVEGDVENHGRIEAGEALLIGRYVENHGVILSDDGLITMLAGEDVYIGRHGDGVLVKIEGSRMAGAAEADQAGVTAGGRIDAGDGQVVMAAGDMYSLAMNVPGLVRGGDVLVEGQGAGRVEVTGSIDATSDTGAGGRIRVLGEDVALEGATLDASGATGGGEILVGGNAQGSGPERNSETTSVDEASRLAADATDSGDGGRIIVWADQTAEIHGAISARGAGGGDGGFVETSGKEGLVLTSAPALGEGGQWLIDPRNLTIVADAPTLGDDTTGIDDASGPPANPVPPTSTTGEFRASENDATLEVGLILQALTDGADVTVFTGGGGGQDGDISVAAPIDYDGTGDNTLRLVALDDITIESGSTIGDGDGGTADSLNLQLDADGDVLILADIDTAGGFFESNGVAFTLGDGANNANITTGGGDVDLIHTGAVAIDNGSITTSGGDFDSAGTTFDLDSAGGGVDAGAGSITLAHSGAVNLTAGSLAAAGGAIGVTTTGGSIAVGAGTLVTAGTSGVALDASDTIDLSAAGDLVVANGLTLDAGTAVTLAGDGVAQTLDAGTGALETSNDLVKDGGAALDPTDSLTLVAQGGVLLDATGGTEQAIRGTNATVEIDGSVTKTGDGTLRLASAGAGGITISGDVTGTNAVSGNDGVVFETDVTLDGTANQRLDGGLGNLRFAGNLTKTDASGVTLTAGAGDAGEVRFNGAGDQAADVGAGTLTLLSDVAKTAAGNLDLTAATVEVGADVTGDAGGGGLDFDGEVRLTAADVAQTIDGNGGEVTFSRDVLKNVSGNFTLRGSQISMVRADAADQTLAASDGFVRVGTGASSEAIAKTAGTGALVLGGDEVRLSASTSAATLDLDASNVVLVGTGAQSLESTASALTIAGDVSATATGTKTLSGAGAGIVFDGAGDQSAEAAAGETLELAAATSKTTAGGLTLGGGTVEVDSTVTGNDGGVRFDADVALTQAVGEQVLSGGTGQLAFGGDVVNAAGGDIGLEGSDVLFDATGAQVVQTTGAVRVGTALAPVSVQKTGANGLALDAASLSLSGDVTGDGGLTLMAATTDATGTGDQQLSGGSQVLDIQGDVTKASGSLTLGATGGVTFSEAGAQSVSVTGIGQTLALSDSGTRTDTGLLTLAASTVEIGADLSGDAAGSGLDFDGDVLFTGVGVEQVVDGGTGALDFAGDVSKTVSGGYALLGSQVSMTGAGTQTVSASQDAARIGAAGDAVAIVKTGGTGTLALGGNDVRLSGNASADALDVNATTITAIGDGTRTWQATSGTLSIAGDLGATGSADVRLAAGGGLTLDGAAAQTLDAGSGRLLTDLDVVKADAFDLTLGSDGGIVLDGGALVEQQVSAGTGTLRLSDAVSRTGGGGLALDGATVAVVDGVSGTNGVRFVPDVQLEGATDHVLDGGAGALRFEGDVVSSGNTGDLDLRGATLELAKGAGLEQRLDAGGGAITTDFDLARAGDLALAGDGGIRLTRADASDQRIDSGAGQLTLESDVVKTGLGRLVLAGAGVAVGADVTGSATAGSGGVALGAVDFTGAGLQTVDAGAGNLDLLDDLAASGGGTVRLDGAAVRADAVGSQSLDGGIGALEFGAALQRTAAGDLALGGDGGVTAEQGVTVSAGALTTSDSFSSAADVSAVGTDFGADVTMTGAGAQTLDAGTGTLLARSDLTSTGGTALFLQGDGGVEVQGDLDVQSGSLALAEAFVAGGDVDVAGSGFFQDTAAFAGDVTANGLTLQSQATFDGVGDQRVDAGGGALTIDGGARKTTAGGLVLDGASVAANTAVQVDAGSLTAESAVDAAADLTASDGMDFLGPVSVLADGVRIDAGAGTLGATDVASGDPGVTQFTLAGGGGVDLSGDLTSSSGSITVENDLALSGNGLQTLSATGSGVSVGGNVTRTGTADVAVTGTLRLTGTGDAVVDLGNGDLDVTGGDLRATNADSFTVRGDDVAVDGLLRSAGDLVVDADLDADAVTAVGNALFQTRADVAGDLTAGGNVRLRDGIDLGGDLDAGGRVRVRGGGITLDGAGGQTVSAGDTLIVAGDITKDTSGRLTLVAANGIDLEGDVDSKGTLELDGHDDALGAPTVATVYRRRGDLLLRSRNGDVRVVGDERIVAADGSLTIEATSGAVEVGDLAARMDVTVESPDITINDRPGGPVQTSSGGTRNDQGPDIVATNVTFSSSPDGAGDLEIATPERGRVSPTLSSALIRTLDVPLDDALFFDGDTVLDPRATGTPRTNLGGIIAAETASLFTEQTQLLQSLNEVAVSAKPLWASEVVAFLECGLFDADDPDLPPECEGFFAEEQGAGEDDRFQSEPARAALETYRFIFSQVDDIRDVFEGAAADYQAATGDQAIEGPAFREYLESTPDAHRAALDYMARLSSLFSQMETMGVQGDDFVEARQLLLDEVAPTDMDVLEFDDALRGSEAGSGGPGRAARPLFAGRPVPGAEAWWTAGGGAVD